MTFIKYCLFAMATTAWGFSAAATPSVNGANIPAESSIVDEQGNNWTLVSDVVEKNGADAGSTRIVKFLLLYKGVFYQENTAGNWYQWNGSSWPQTTDPRSVSTSGASIGVGTSVLVDSAKNVWTLTTGEIAYINGKQAASNHNTTLLVYYGGAIYCENTSGDWYMWTGSNWTEIPGDPRGPHVAQYVTYTSPACPASDPGCTPTFEGNSPVTFRTSTTKGNTIWVAATVSDYGGLHTITVQDSQGNSYHYLNQENDKAPGSQSVAQFYATDIKGGADTVTVDWTADNYKGVVAVEIGGVLASSFVGNSANIQDGQIPAGSDNVTSKNVSVGSTATPALLIALTMDTDGGGSDIGGSGYCAIPSGSGYTQVTQLWSWAVAGKPVCNLATLETKVVTNAGASAGTSTTTHLSDPYITMGAVFR